MAVRTELPRQRRPDGRPSGRVRLRRKVRPQGLKRRTELKLCPYDCPDCGAPREHFYLVTED